MFATWLTWSACHSLMSMFYLSCFSYLTGTAVALFNIRFNVLTLLHDLYRMSRNQKPIQANSLLTIHFLVYESQLLYEFSCSVFYGQCDLCALSFYVCARELYSDEHHWVVFANLSAICNLIPKIMPPVVNVKSQYSLLNVLLHCNEKLAWT